MSGLSTERQTGRNQVLDIAKGLGILAVFVGHSVYWDSASFKVIFFFHMPLFFIVSGMLFNAEKYRTYRDVFGKMILGFVVPYFFFVVIANVVQFDVFAPRWENSFLKMFYLTFIQGFGAFALWFLTALGMVQLFAFGILRSRILNRSRVRLVTLIVLCLSACFLSDSMNSTLRHLPVMLVSVPSALFFFLLGCYGKKLIGWFCARCVAVPWLMIVGVISFAGLYCFVRTCSIRPFDLGHGRFEVCGLLPCFLGLISIFCLSVFLAKCKTGGGGVMAFIGKYSLIFFAMEQNFSHLMTVSLNSLGFSLPEVFYNERTSVWLVTLRIFFCLCGAAAVAVPLMHIVRILQNRATLCLGISTSAERIANS